jgi:hypothetical protein
MKYRLERFAANFVKKKMRTANPKNDAGEKQIRHQHHKETGHDGHDRLGNHWQSPGEHFAEGVDIVGKDRHDVAMPRRSK